MFEHTNITIRSRKWENDRQYNSQTKKANNDL